MDTSHTARSMSLRRVVASDSDGEDSIVDFANASLYLAGMQTVFTIVACAFVSILSCWIVPSGGVSAVRTLALCVATGSLLMLKPLRIGRSHGLKIVFSSLQPAVPIYLLALVVEQLVHTCTSNTSNSPSWRRVVFNGMILVMLIAGAMRARHPLKDTDSPFLLTATALLVIAIMPPPAVALVGPLCQSVTLWEAADRLVRALAFALVYCVHAYSLTLTTRLTKTDSLIVVTRSASASMWTLGAHVSLLPAAIVQSIVVVIARIQLEQGLAYAVVDAASDDDELSRIEMATTEQQSVDVIAEQLELLAQPTAAAPPHPRFPASDQEAVTSDFGPLAFRDITSTSTPTASGHMSDDRLRTFMADVASRISD